MTVPSFERANQSESSVNLVIGIDGSGKSTFLKTLQDNLGYHILEPTSTPEARAFKKASLDTPIDQGFIDDREAIFTRLNRDFDQQILTAEESYPHIATTGNLLITKVSHEVMRSIVIGESKSIDQIVAEWAESDALIPTSVVLVHAPDHVIRDRIKERQKAGDSAEKFWGFNSQHFLRQYQAGLIEALSSLAVYTKIRHMTLDSSELSPTEMLEIFESQAS